MKTRILLSLFIASTLFSYSQCPGSPPTNYTCIPDSNFEQALIDLMIDSEGGSTDGQVLTADITSVIDLDISAYFISDLTGIEDFTSLQTLNCGNSNLTSLNLLNNNALTEIRCFSNFLTSLTLPSTGTNLIYLNCGGNTNLNTVDVTPYINLEELILYNIGLTSINLSGNPNLELLNVQGNSNLTTISTDDNPNLDRLFAYNCGLTSLDIDQSILLRILWVYNCPSLSSLDISTNTQLEDLRCFNNSLSSLDFTNNALLTYVNCGGNMLSSIDTSPLSNIDLFWCWSNDFSSLDFSSNSTLRSLDCGDNSSLMNNLTLPTVKTSLEQLWVYTNNMSSLNYSEYPNLVLLDIGINDFTSADVSMLPNLEDFYVNSNQLTYLNLKSGNSTNLTFMGAQNNPSLTCIQVDDVSDANMKTSNGDWTKDVGASYSTSCPPLSTENFDLSSIKLYPNPTKNLLTVETDLNLEYSIYNVLGKRVKTGKLNFSEKNIELSSLSKGIYLLDLTSEVGSVTKKIIKQ